MRYLVNIKENFTKSFYNILKYIILTMVLIIVIFSNVLYIYFEKAGFKIIYEYNRKVLSQISYNLNYMNEMVKNFCIAQFLDSDNAYLMYHGHDDTHQIQKVINKFQKTVLSNGMLHSAIIYNNRINYYYSTFGAFGSVEEVDKDILQIMKSEENKKMLSPIPRVLNSQNYYQDTSVFTYIMNDRKDSSGMPDSALIVNVKTDWLFENLKKNSSKDLNFIITDENGRVIVDGSGEYSMFDKIDRSYADKLYSEKKTDSIISNINGSKYVITYLPIPDTNWVLINEQPYSVFFSDISTIRNMILLITAVFLLLAGVASILVAKSIYMPFGNLVKQVRSMLAGGSNTQNNEDDTEYLYKVFKLSQSRLQYYEQYEKSVESILRENFLKAILLEGNFINTLMFKQNIENFSELFCKENMNLLIIIKIDRLTEFAKLERKERRRIRAYITNTIKEGFFGFCTNEVVFVDSGEYAVILNITSGNNTDDNATVYKILESIQNKVNINCGFTISAFISKKIEDFHSLYIHYKKTQSISKYRIIHGANCILDIMNVESIENKCCYPEDIEARIIKHLKLGNYEDVIKDYHTFISLTCENNIDSFMFFMMRMTMAIHETIQQININVVKRLNVDFDSFYKDILNSETLEQINDKFINLFKNIADQKEENSERKYDVIVNSIQDYINMEYTRKDISLKKIASEFKMSQSYVGKIFKDATGISVASYINDIRLKKAKQLLEVTNQTVNQIMDSTGYDNESYFYKLFMKVYGLTPKEYRVNKALKDMSVK